MLFVNVRVGVVFNGNEECDGGHWKYVLGAMHLGSSVFSQHFMSAWPFHFQPPTINQAKSKGVTSSTV